VVKESRNFRLSPEILEMLRQLSRQSGKVFGTHLSQAQIVEMAIRRLAKEERG
jgi:predicted DNA-binding protein